MLYGVKHNNLCVHLNQTNEINRYNNGEKYCRISILKIGRCVINKCGLMQIIVHNESF